MRLPTVLLVALVCLSALPDRARADEPPPSGRKYVGFEFKVDNLAAFPDYVLVAYPTSQSGGAPTYELSVLEEGKAVRLGRRSPTSSIYALKKAEFETFHAGYKPAAERGPDKALEAFLASKAVKCDKGPTRVSEIAKSDARDVVSETLKLTKLDATSCTLDVTSAPEPAATKGGCGACAVSAPARSATSPVLLAFGLVLVAARRVGARRRLAQTHPLCVDNDGE